MTGKIGISNADLDTMLKGSVLQGIVVFRRLTGFDLRTSKSAVEQFQGGSKDWRDFFELMNACPHCGGSGLMKGTS